MSQPGDPVRPQSSAEDSFLDLLVETLGGLDETVRGPFLQRFFKTSTQIELTEAQSLDDVAERRIAYNEALQSGVLVQSEYSAAIKDLNAQEAALTQQSEKYVTSMNSLADKYSGTSSAAAKLTADEKSLNDALTQGAISAEKHAAAIAGIAAQKSALGE